MSKKKALDWLKDLSAILEHLEEIQMKKLRLIYLTEIPRGLTEGKSRDQICQLILEHYGPEDSVLVIQDAMEKIPRKDSTVQDLLRPHLDRLKDKENRQGGKKRRVQNESDSVGASGASQASGEEQNKCKQDEKPQRKTIADVLRCATVGNKVTISGKLVEKSRLSTYQTKKNKTISSFYVSVADHTDCLKVMVYGPEHYNKLQPGQIYCFRNVLLEVELLKTTAESSMDIIKIDVDVPEHIKVRAESLIYPQSPVCSIADAKSTPKDSTISVEGTITKIGVLFDMKLKAKRRTTKPKRDFWISDGSDSIQVCLWGEDVQQLRGHSNGDRVRVINVRTNRFNNVTSLNSTFDTRIIKLNDAMEQDVSIEVIGVPKATRTHTELLTPEMKPFFVQSQVLAKALGIRLEGDLEDQVLKKIPFSAQVQVKGSTINEINSVKFKR